MDFLNARAVIARPETNLINRALGLVTILHVLICSSRSVSSIFRVFIRQIAAIVREANRPCDSICRPPQSFEIIEEMLVRHFFLLLFFALS